MQSGFLRIIAPVKRFLCVKRLFSSWKRGDKYIVECVSVESLETAAEQIANISNVGDIILLSGDLGAGKTCFSRAFIRHINGDPEMPVTSPSYLLDNTYPCPTRNCDIHHMDLYRLFSGTDLSLLGIPKIFSSSISLIEWPDRMFPSVSSGDSTAGITSTSSSSSSSHYEDMLSPFANACLEIEMKIAHDQSRQLRISAYGTFQERVITISSELMGEKPITDKVLTKWEHLYSNSETIYSDPITMGATIVRGFRRGSTELGFPTANLDMDELGDRGEALNTGVYFGWAKLSGNDKIGDNKCYSAVVSVGWNPFYKNTKKTVEVHLLADDRKGAEKGSLGDLYGLRLEVALCGFLRDMHDFSSVEELVSCIETDISRSRSHLERCSSVYEELKTNSSSHTNAIL